MKSRKKIIGIMLSFAMMCSLCGCETKKLDGPVTAEAPSQKMEVNEEFDNSSDEKEDKIQETEETEEYFDLDSIGDENVDYSKYQEKDDTSKEKKDSEEKKETEESSLVTYSDGKQEEQDQYHTDAVPKGKQNPVEPDDVEINQSHAMTCYMSISCKTILDNMDSLTEGKESLVPQDGIIYPQQKVTFYEGESVFDVLLREVQNHRIHMEYSFTPKFNSNYIEGIHNLYEFDCGEYSGWMYKVNDWFPNYGCSRYVLQDGDVVEWVYTCDLGRDVGNYYER